MEPISSLEELEKTLSYLLDGIGTTERLRKALGPNEQNRLTGLLGAVFMLVLCRFPYCLVPFYTVVSTCWLC